MQQDMMLTPFYASYLYVQYLHYMYVYFLLLLLQNQNP